MPRYTRNNNWCPLIVAWRWWLIIILLPDLAGSQELFQSRIVFDSTGTQFSPVNATAQLFSTMFTNSLQKCAIACNNNILCRIFDFGVILPQQCRLFEGDITTMGTVISSPSSTSTVGSVQLSPALFAEYGLACSSACQQSRYLTCSNSTCQCQPHSYWNGSMCVAQSPVLGATCQQNMSMCREDLNYTCLQFNQCGPISILSGTTIADSNTVIGGSSTVGFSKPLGIIVDAPVFESIIVADENNNQVVRLWDGNSGINNISVLASNWTTGNQLLQPNDLFLDVKGGNNLYVSDSGNNRVVMFTAMQSVAPPPRVVAGTGTGGTGTNQFYQPNGIALDHYGNLIIVDHFNHRVMLYAPNATYGTMIAGSGTAGNDSMSLFKPLGLFLDEKNSWLYVCDTYNNRIQRFSLNGSSRLNGTTVAGGNGQGSGSHQLYEPYGIWVSNKTGDMYIADSINNRVQRWSQGATEGVTIAGDPNGTPGNTATMLNQPSRLTGNANETLLYVSDQTNRRIQRFQLI